MYEGRQSKADDLFLCLNEMRKYIAADFACNNWSEVEAYLIELSKREWSVKADFIKWLRDKSELEAVLEENIAAIIFCDRNSAQPCSLRRSVESKNDGCVVDR